MKHLKLISIISIWVGLDLISKYFFYDLNYLQDTKIIDAVLNKWISRSLPVPFFIIIWISIIGFIAIFRIYKKKQIWYFITGILLAWSLGIFIDRIIYWGVRDFINIWFFNFPIFNIADIMLTIGVWLRILKIILEKKK